MKIEDVALLARLKITEAENKLFTGQIDNIIGYIDKLNELDTTDVEPTAHILPIKNILREDVPVSSLPLERALQNAPDRSDAFYRVPKIID
jgi:aspartyl-tRNA(Asn)/glutamyl-tRNA(Gln) amidotransferase subunit C